MRRPSKPGWDRFASLGSHVQLGAAGRRIFVIFCRRRATPSRNNSCGHREHQKKKKNNGPTLIEHIFECDQCLRFRLSDDALAQVVFANGSAILELTRLKCWPTTHVKCGQNIASLTSLLVQGKSTMRHESYLLS